MKKTLLKKIFVFVFVTFVSISAFSETINDMQLFKADSWVYSALERLGTEGGVIPGSFNAPLTAGEIKFYFSEIDREVLTESGKVLYDELEKFLYTKPKHLEAANFYAALNVKLNPEFYVKTNQIIDWTYNYYYSDNLGTLKILLGLYNYVTFECEPFLGKNYGAMQKAGNFTNIMLDVVESEFQQPRWANVSFGYNSKNWGINFIIGKEGFQIGQSLTGSVIQNRTFMTDFFTQLNVYTKIFKITWGVSEVSVNRFLYTHQFEVRPFKKLRIAVGESALLDSSFEIRFLNPIMPYHSYSARMDYNKSDIEYYTQAHFCDYLGVLIEYAPIPTSRFYIYYAQNELQLPWEDPQTPNSIGVQVGTESSFNAPGNGYWVLGLEGIWTTPYLYVKHGAPWSLYRDYIPTHDARGPDNHVYSWLGTPFGPDCMGAELKFGYDKAQKWSADFVWVFTAHGEKGFDMFKEKITDADGNERYYYYPAVKYNNPGDDKSGKTPEEVKAEALADALNLFPSGVVEYKNQVSIKGTYNFNRHFSISGQIVYIFAYNYKNTQNNFQQGAEFTISGTYRLF